MLSSESGRKSREMLFTSIYCTTAECNTSRFIINSDFISFLTNKKPVSILHKLKTNRKLLHILEMLRL